MYPTHKGTHISQVQANLFHVISMGKGTRSPKAGKRTTILLHSKICQSPTTAPWLLHCSHTALRVSHHHCVPTTCHPLDRPFWPAGHLRRQGSLFISILLRIRTLVICLSNTARWLTVLPQFPNKSQLSSLPS